MLCLSIIVSLYDKTLQLTTMDNVSLVTKDIIDNQSDDSLALQLQFHVFMQGCVYDVQ